MSALIAHALSVFRLLYAHCVTVYPFLLCYLGVGATLSRRLACGYPPLVSQDVECDSVLCVLLVVVLSRSPWSPFSTARVKRRGKTVRGPDARESVYSVHTSMTPRRRPREGVAEQATRQEVGDAPPPQQTQPLPQDAHSGIVPPPPPPPQVAQGLDMTRFLEGMAQFVAQHRDAPVPQGGTGRFLGQPDLDAARAWLDAVERTFRSMECVPEERALTWWSAEWETTFQSRPLRQIPWQEFVVSFERAFCPTYVRTKRLYQFLDLQQRDSNVVQYRARFVELGRYAPQIMGDEGLRTQQFVRGLRPELRQALIVARVTDLDAAYQTAAALEADTLRTRARSAEVQTQVVPSQPHQQ
ncbi:hypothetical protein Taro_013067 [Colocasia esculenta]|uniref:Retrotransposon gag domain-containing protein n=1 Tax=Colocasia esculenta TaxID=4460 RepID=A0A843UF83_COLES|nr:hypothetical protein [Colocasia esculenta]